MSSMQSDRTAPQRSSAIFENFRTFPAFKATEIKSRLEPRQRSFREPKPKPEIATALSSTGWLATASQSSIRLFRLEGINQTRDIRRVALIECSPEYGKVRAIAISEDILAVITYSHLLLYEYKQIVNNAVSCVDVRQIDQNQAWTPKSVAIRQRGIVGVGLDADAWLAIGGEGKIGVKLFRYSYKTCWNAQSDRINLTCARNTSSMRLVSFSPDFPYTGDQIIVVGATESNKIYCWGVGHGSGRRALEPSWILNCDRRTDGVPHRGEIASATVFISPSRRPYLFCAINQKRGSRIIRSFTAYLDPAQRDQGTTLSGWRELPEEAIRRNALCGTVTANGHYIAAIDDRSMRLLLLQGGYQGGLTCPAQPLEWSSSLESTATDVSGISIAIKEHLGALEIISVDGRGRIEFRRVSVPQMPPPPDPTVRRPRASEMSTESALRELTGELSGSTSEASTMATSLSGRSTTAYRFSSTVATSIPSASAPRSRLSLSALSKSLWTAPLNLTEGSASQKEVSGEGSPIVPSPETIMSECFPNPDGSSFINPSLSDGNYSSSDENYRNSDGERSHIKMEQRSPTIEAAPFNLTNETGSLRDPSFGTNAQISSNDRLLNPTGYLDNIKKLRQVVFQNSAMKNENLKNKSKVTRDSLSCISDGKTLLHELHDMIAMICQSLTHLQYSAYCGGFFSILVLDRARPTVAHLLPIEVARVLRLGKRFMDIIRLPEEPRFRNGNVATTNDPFAIDLKTRQAKDLTSACRNLLVQAQIIPSTAESLSPAYLWATAVHFLDLAVLSYVGTHTEDLDDNYRDSSDGELHIPGRFGVLRGSDMEHLASGNTIIVQKRKLQCLDQFLRHRSVWVFQNTTTRATDERLYLSTDVTTLADIWGPLWKIKPGVNPQNISRYDIGNGFIVPWDREPESDPDPCSNSDGAMEVFCHWISSRDWDDTYVEHHQAELQNKSFFETDRLLIGASVKHPLAVNGQCNMSRERKLKIKQEMKNAGNLRHRGTCKPRQEKGSQSFQVQASAMGFATFGTTMEYKRIGGFNIKDALLQRWRNGSRNVKYLEMWGGVEVSLCTENARRVQLLHLLRSRGMRKYLKAISFQWIDPECETAYFEALQARRSFRKLWAEHPKWQRNIGDAINECFIALEDTGVDERDSALSALWVEEFEDDDECEEKDSGCSFVAAEEHLIVLRRSGHSWTGLLKDSPEILTMVIAEDICLSFNASDGSGVRCEGLRLRKDEKITRPVSHGYSVLQTAILINEDLLEVHNSCELHYQSLSFKQKIAEEQNGVKERDNCRLAVPSPVDPAAYLIQCFGDASRSWEGYWDPSCLVRGRKFSLGSHGHLKLLFRLIDSYPVLMEWQPVLNTVGKDLKVGIKERGIGKSGDRHHSEYMEGAFDCSPLPCLIRSSTKRDVKKTPICI